MITVYQGANDICIRRQLLYLVQQQKGEGGVIGETANQRERARSRARIRDSNETIGAKFSDATVLPTVTIPVGLRGIT